MNNWQKVINVCLAIFITLYIYNMDKFEKQIADLSADIENLHIKLDSLKQYSDGVIALIGGSKSFFSNLLARNKYSYCVNEIKKLQQSFKNNIYIEIQRHKEDHENLLEKKLFKISTELQLPLIATNEVYYLEKDIAEAHDAYLCVGEKSYVNDKSRQRYSSEHYLKSTEEFLELFKDLPDALENNKNLKYKVNFFPKKNSPLLPSFVEDGRDVNEYLKKEAHAGLNERLQKFILPDIDQNEDKDNVIKLYKERLDYEISVISNMNFAGYFLIVSDYINWAKSNNIPVGPGRGSGAGSLVAWCLSITDVDPIKFNLIFERFLNPDRISMPDFDIDFCEEKRDQVFKYLTTKYKDSVAHIITFGKLKARMVIRDVGRVLGLPYGFIDSICKMIPFDPSRPLTLQESINVEPRLQKLIKLF